MPDHPNQTALPYEDADCALAERKNDLALALMHCNADVYLCNFLRLVFEATHGGLRGESIQTTNVTLAAKPWGLCCSVSKARDTIARATGLELVRRVEDAADDRSCGELKRFQIHWPGVMALKRGGIGRAPPATIEHPPAVLKQGGDLLRRGSRAQRENSPSENSLQEQENLSSFPHSFSSQENKKEGVKEGGRFSSAGPWREFPRELSHLPELVDAWPGKVAPLPLGKLAYDPFALTTKDLEGGHLVLWFRKQLSLPRPFLGESQAELVLAIAAAVNAVKCPNVKSPRRLFEAQVRRGQWDHALRFVPQAIGRLDELLAKWPHCLTHPEGAGPHVDQFSPERSQHGCRC